MKDKIKSITETIALMGIAIIALCAVIMSLVLSIVAFSMGNILLGITLLILFIILSSAFINTILEKV